MLIHYHFILPISCHPLLDRGHKLQLNAKEYDLVQTWCNTAKSWARICWTSQIASQWTVGNDETISSYKLYSASVPSTKQCQEVLIYFTSSNPGTWKITQTADPLCLFQSTENSSAPTIYCSPWETLILCRNFTQKVVTHSKFCRLSRNSPLNCCSASFRIRFPFSSLKWYVTWRNPLSGESFYSCCFITWDELTTQI